MIDVLILKGHGGPDGMQVGDDGIIIVGENGDILIGDENGNVIEDVTDVLNDITNYESDVCLRGCNTMNSRRIWMMH